MNAHLKLFTTAHPSWFKWLVQMEMLRYVRLNLSEGRQKIMDEYLRDKLQISWTSSQIIQFAARHLRFAVVGNVQVVSIDTEMLLPNTSFYLIDLVRLINYGNLEVRGNRVIQEAFQYLEQNMNRILLGKVM